MSLKPIDIKILRALPYPNHTDKVEACIKKFVDVIYAPKTDMIRVIKAIHQGQKQGMLLPAYIRPLNKDEKEKVKAGMDLMMDKDREEEKKKYMAEASETEKYLLRYLFFLDRLEHWQEQKGGKKL